MKEERIHFSSIKEGRGSYYVEYHLPNPGFSFAMLQLSFPGAYDASLVAKIMEAEAVAWVNRFPVSLMASAFDNVDDTIELDGVRPCRHLICMPRHKGEKPEMHWRLVPDEEMPRDALEKQFLLQVYKDVPRKTSSELRALADRKAREIRVGWYIVFAWAVVLPAAVLILEFFSPTWVTVLILIYGLSKAVVKALKMLGKIKPSAAEVKKAEEERRMKHHHYHCERNPEGFLRLRTENLKREFREKNEKEAASLGVSSERGAG